MGVILSFTFIAILRHLPIAHHDEEYILCVNALKLIELYSKTQYGFNV